jgi:hypothetical protein
VDARRIGGQASCNDKLICPVCISNINESRTPRAGRLDCPRRIVLGTVLSWEGKEPRRISRG